MAMLVGSQRSPKQARLVESQWSPRGPRLVGSQQSPRGPRLEGSQWSPPHPPTHPPASGVTAESSGPRLVVSQRSHRPRASGVPGPGLEESQWSPMTQASGVTAEIQGPSWWSHGGVTGPTVAQWVTPWPRTTRAPFCCPPPPPSSSPCSFSAFPAISLGSTIFGEIFVRMWPGVLFWFFVCLFFCFFVFLVVCFFMNQP